MAFVNVRPPFGADLVMTLMSMQLNDSVQDLYQFELDVTDDLIAIIDQVFSKDCNKRYQSVAALTTHPYKV